MKNFRLSALLCCVSLCGFAACSDDKTDDQPEPQAYQVTQFESSTIPASIPGEGGGYKLTFVIRTETRSTGATFEPWAYRLTLGDAVGDAVTVTKPTTEIAITIPPNRSKEERGVAVEMASGVKAETWTKIVEATQEGSLKDYQVTKFESTTIPATVPAGGGDYDVLFRLEVETRAAAPLFVAWQYRVTLGDAVGDAVEVTEPTEKIGIHIDASESVEERAVIVEMAEVAETPVVDRRSSVGRTQEVGQEGIRGDESSPTTIPASVPFAGGDYEVKFRTKIETRATPQFEPWQYRLTVGEAVGEPVAVNEPTESVAVHIGANYSEKEVDVIFETALRRRRPCGRRSSRRSSRPAWSCSAVSTGLRAMSRSRTTGSYWPTNRRIRASSSVMRAVTACRRTKQPMPGRPIRPLRCRSRSTRFPRTKASILAVSSIPLCECRLTRNFRNFTTARTYSARRTALREWAIRAYRSSCPIAVS